jgi:hypothetical protein
MHGGSFAALDPAREEARPPNRRWFADVRDLYAPGGAHRQRMIKGVLSV